MNFASHFSKHAHTHNVKQTKALVLIPNPSLCSGYNKAKLPAEMPYYKICRELSIEDRLVLFQSKILIPPKSPKEILR